MDFQGKSSVKSNGEPLCVLTYRTHWKIFTVFCVGFLVFFFGVSTFVLLARNTIHSLYNPVMGFFFLLFASRLIDILLFSEIRLYPDRMVKVWKLLGSKEIRLANARLRGGNMMGAGGKTLFNKDTNVYLGWLLRLFHLTGITYAEHFADPEAVKKLNTILADLSGRKVEDFEARRISMDKLIEGDKK
jgi:hypothetical protein